MKDALKKLGVCLWAMLHEYLTSKKVVTFVLTSLAAKFIADPSVRDRVVAAGLALLVAQGAQDAGKAAAVTKAAGPPVAATPTLFPPAGTKL